MFWKYNSLAGSHLDTLLDKQGVTLAEILEQEDIIQECKSQNKKLVDYLTKQDVLSELLDLILQEPSVELEERLRFKLPNIASEVITCDVAQINEKLSSDTTLLDKMYAFLEGPPPLNPLLTSFFSKAFGVLITRSPDQNWYSYQYTCLQVIEYIKAKEGFTGRLLTHIGTSAVMDLLLRLITCVEGTDNKQNILTWLNDERLIQRVLGLLTPSGFGEGGGGGNNGDSQVSHLAGEEHDNAGQLMVEIIRLSRDAQMTEYFHNPLMNTAESPDMVQLLLGYMLDGPVQESTIINGVEVLLALLEIRSPAPQGGGFYPYTTEQDNNPNQADIKRQQAVRQSTVECIIPRLNQFTDLLLNPPYKPPVRNSCGLLDPPLGRTRLSVAKLFAVLLSTNHGQLNTAMTNANVSTILLDLFFKYSLNNFLHAQVESCLRSIIFWKEKADLDVTQDNVITPEVTDNSSLQTPKVSEGGADEDEPGKEEKDCKHPLDDFNMVENPALIHLMTNAKLVDRLVAAWSVTEVGPQVCYMGHVTRITNYLVTAGGEGSPCQSRTLLLQLMAKLPEETMATWTSVVLERLQETNKLNEVKPAGEDKRNLSSDEDSDFRDIQFPQDNSALQQMQEMSENFIDSFGFHDDEFTESDENISRGMRKLNSVNFLMQTDDSTKQAIFDSVCEQRIKAFNSDEDPWEDKTAEISFGVGGSGSQAKDNEEVDSSDEENEAAPVKMEVDNDQDPWETVESSGVPGGPVAMDTSSPWGSGAQVEEISTTPVVETGWANFSAFSSEGSGGEVVTSSGGLQEDQTMEEGELGTRGEGWSPAMSSSPEATMLDCSTSSERSGSPSLISRLSAGPPDISDSNANPAPVPSDRTQSTPDTTVESDSSKTDDNLTDNFSFLAARGLISSSDAFEPDHPGEADIKPVVADSSSTIEISENAPPEISSSETTDYVTSEKPEVESSTPGDPPPSSSA